MMSERFTAWTLSLAQRDGVLAMLFVLAACLVFAFAVVYAQLDGPWRKRLPEAVMMFALVIFYGTLFTLVVTR